MKIVYFGSDVFLGVFRYLLKFHEILALYTYHNDEDYFNERNLVHLAHQHDIPVHYNQISETEMIEWIDQCGCELFFVAEYSHKLPVPSHAAFRGINLHSSLLPEGRSYYPIECAMELGLDHTGVTAHKLTNELDRGAILAQRSFSLTVHDDSVDAYLYSGQAAREMTEEIMTNFDRYWQRSAQLDKMLPYWKRPDAEVLTLRHDMTVHEAQALYRKFNKMTLVQIDRQAYFVDGFHAGNATIGRRDEDIIFVRDNRVLYGVTDGHLRLDIQLVPTR